VVPAALGPAELELARPGVAPDQAEERAARAPQVVLTPVRTIIPRRQAAVSILSPLVGEAWRPILPPGNRTIPETSTIRTTPPIQIVRRGELFKERAPHAAQLMEFGCWALIAMKSLMMRRSLVIAGHKTSISLENAFWEGLKEIAGGRNMTVADLVAAIDTERKHANLSSAIRLFVLSAYRDQQDGPKSERKIA
jgi:predicted DNA-binding ribbon-helix-helix protein